MNQMLRLVNGTNHLVGALLALLVITTCLVEARATPADIPASAALSGMIATSEVSTEVAFGPQIAIAHFMFGPATLTVRVGTTVVWVNQDDDLHTVTSSNGLFSSPGLDVDDVFSYRFTTPGTY